MHDISINQPEAGCNVYRFWEEIKVRYRNTEIISKRSQVGFGIGVLYVD
jgi:hypothetical protein